MSAFTPDPADPVSVALGNLTNAVSAQSVAITDNASQITSSITSLGDLIHNLEIPSASTDANVAQINNLLDGISKSTQSITNATSTLQEATSALEVSS